MRRGFGIGFAVLAIVIAIAIGIGSYNVGYNHGLDVNGSVQVVHYVGGWHGGGFFPFGLFLFPLFLFGFFGLMRAAFMGGRWHDHHDHHGPMGPGGPGGTGGWSRRQEMFEDWHRRQHEPGQGQGGSAGGEPART